jgi:hypothetical protein
LLYNAHCLLCIVFVVHSVFCVSCSLCSMFVMYRVLCAACLLCVMFVVQRVRCMSVIVPHLSCYARCMVFITAAVVPKVYHATSEF